MTTTQLTAIMYVVSPAIRGKVWAAAQTGASLTDILYIVGPKARGRVWAAAQV
jgi:hypothetical protein